MMRRQVKWWSGVILCAGVKLASALCSKNVLLWHKVGEGGGPKEVKGWVGFR